MLSVAEHADQYAIVFDAAKTIAGATIRFSEDASICMVQDGDEFRCATQADMDTLSVGDDLTTEEIEGLES